MKNTCKTSNADEQKNKKKRNGKPTTNRRALTCLTIFAIGMKIVTATRSTETYDSKQKSEMREDTNHSRDAKKPARNT